jgi:hypothetical protein
MLVCWSKPGAMHPGLCIAGCSTPGVCTVAVVMLIVVNSISRMCARSCALVAVCGCASCRFVIRVGVEYRVTMPIAISI